MNVLDLVLTTSLVGTASYAAVANSTGTMRLPVIKGKDVWWNDWRTVIGGVSLTGMGLARNKGWRRFWGILSVGSLGSLLATEATRMVVVKRAAGGQWGINSAAQLPGTAPVAALPGGSPETAIPTPQAQPAAAPATTQGLGWAGW